MEDEPAEKFTETRSIANLCKKIDAALIKHGFSGGNVIHKEYRHRDAPCHFKADSDTQAVMFRPGKWRRAAVSILSRSGAIQDFVGQAVDNGREKVHLLVKFDTSSQTPRILFKVILQENSEVLVSIFGPCLEIGNQASIQLRTHPENRSTTDEVHRCLDQTILIKANAYWSSQATNKALTLMRMCFKKENNARSSGKDNNFRVVIEGDITNAELDEFVARVSKSHSHGSANTPGALLALLWSNQAHELRLFFPREQTTDALRGIETGEIWRFGSYMCKVMQLTALYGHFYWYRLQQGGGIGNANYNFKDIHVPRWMVTAWSAKDQQNWASFSMDTSLMLPEEFRFQIRLCAVRLRQYEVTRLRPLLVDAQAAEPFVARFMQIPRMETSYVAFINTGLSEHLLSSGLRPRVGQAVKLSIVSPRIRMQHAYTIADRWHSKADFVVCCSGPANLGNTHEAPVAFEHTSTMKDELRHMHDALIDLYQDPQELNGYNPTQLLGGLSLPANADSRGYLEQLEHTGELADMKNKLSESRFGLNETQIIAAASVLKSPTSTAVIDGPSGLSKTATLHAAISMLAESRMPVLVCVATQSSLSSLLEHHISTMAPSPIGDDWCVYRGAYMYFKHPSRPPTEPALQSDKTNIRYADEELDDNIAAAYWSCHLMDGDEHYDALAEYGFQNRRLKFTARLPDLYTPNTEDYDDLVFYRNNITQFGNLKDRPSRRRMKNLDMRYSFLYLQSCKVVYCTLDQAADSMLTTGFEPKVIVLDDIGTANIIQCAIPLLAYQNFAKLVILAGDSGQKLSSVSESRNEMFELIRHSFLSRLIKSNKYRRLENRCPVTLLNTQSDKDSDTTGSSDEHSLQVTGSDDRSTGVSTSLSITLNDMFRRVYRFLDGQQSHIGVGRTSHEPRLAYNGRSRINVGETDTVISLVLGLLCYLPESPDGSRIMPSDIMVLTTHHGQSVLIQEKLAIEEMVDSARQVRVMTLDQAEGEEANIVVLSLCSHDESELASISDTAKLNLARVRGCMLQLTIGAFSKWKQAIADNAESMPSNDVAQVSALIHSLHDDGHIIDHADLETLLNHNAIRRDAAIYPREFVAKSVQDDTIEDQSGAKRPLEEDAESEYPSDWDDPIAYSHTDPVTARTMQAIRPPPRKIRKRKHA